MGRRGVDQTRRISEQRQARRSEFVRSLVDAGSPRIVRKRVATGGGPGQFKRTYLPGIGDRSGKLTVTGYVLTESLRGLAGIIVACACGAPEYRIESNNFKRFKSTRCDLCAKRAGREKRFWRFAGIMPDDEHRRRLINRIGAAATRCNSPNDASYRNYGARGIRVHPAWIEDRGLFLQYVQTLPGWDDPALDMDRIDTDGDYAPGNLRFCTRRENTLNRRSIPILEAENRRLRSEVSRLQAQVHDLERSRTPTGP